MDAQLTAQMEAQNKISKIVKARHEQLSELKLYFDINNKKFYKDVTQFGPNLQKFEILFRKYDYRIRCENILSLALSLGKIIDLNNSVKTILLAIKVFQEHNNFLKNMNVTEGKSFITKMFEKTNSIPITQNEFIKERMKTNWDKSDSFVKMLSFYQSLFKNDTNFFVDFSRYLTFQTDSKSKSNSNFKMDDFNNKLNKIMSGSYSISYQFYNRVHSSFELDYPSAVYSACDIFYMLYNKMMDKICYNPNLLPYIEELDGNIITFFIKPCSNDLVNLSDFIIQSEIDELNANIDKIYN